MHDTQAPEHKLLSERKAAAAVGVDSKTLAAWRVRGVGPPHYQITTKTIRYDMDSLRDWLASKKVAA